MAKKWYDNINGGQFAAGVGMFATLIVGYAAGSFRSPDSIIKEPEYRVESNHLHTTDDGTDYILSITNDGGKHISKSEDGKNYTNVEIIDRRKNASLLQELESAKTSSDLEDMSK